MVLGRLNSFALAAPRLAPAPSFSLTTHNLTTSTLCNTAAMVLMFLASLKLDSRRSSPSHIPPYQDRG